MNCVADFCVVPIGVGVSVSREVAECQRVLARSGLKYSMHAYGTNVEGDWDAVMAVIKECHTAVHALGCQRISTTIKVGTRTDKVQSMDDKVRKVEQILAGDS